MLASVEPQSGRLAFTRSNPAWATDSRISSYSDWRRGFSLSVSNRTGIGVVVSMPASARICWDSAMSVSAYSSEPLLATSSS